jgi:cephalosporin hydroxylase
MAPVGSRLRSGIRGRVRDLLENRLGARVTGWALQRTLMEQWRQTNDAATVTWLGRRIRQYPTDAWLLQEMVCALRPDAIIETGTLRGGSAVFFGDLCKLLGHGHVVSVDIDPLETPAHARVVYITGSSIDHDVIAKVQAAARAHGANVFVMLDSKHSAGHVRAELDAYADLVPVGGYVHVQDGWSWNGRSLRLRPAGPRLAAEAFLADRRDFIRDEEVERRYLLTAHPYGWLRRVS